MFMKDPKTHIDENLHEYYSPNSKRKTIKNDNGENANLEKYFAGHDMDKYFDLLKQPKRKTKVAIEGSGRGHHNQDTFSTLEGAAIHSMSMFKKN